jgi:nitrite reductase (NADH) small subunit
MDNNLIPVCKAEDIPENIGKSFFIGDIEIVVFNNNNLFYAFDNNCPHQNAPILHQGFLEDSHLVCPNHLFMFDLETGKMKNSGLKLKKHTTSVKEGNVYIKLNDE